jgi:hypothetical protein
MHGCCSVRNSCAARSCRLPYPETLISKLESRNPVPYYRKPRPETRNPKPENLNAHPSSPNPKAETLDCSGAGAGRGGRELRYEPSSPRAHTGFGRCEPGDGGNSSSRVPTSPLYTPYSVQM